MLQTWAKLSNDSTHPIIFVLLDYMHPPALVNPRNCDTVSTQLSYMNTWIAAMQSSSTATHGTEGCARSVKLCVMAATITSLAPAAEERNAFTALGGLH